jgi:putative transcriptional regulator
MRRTRGGRNNSDNDVDNPPLTEEQLQIVRAGVPNIRVVRRHMGMTQQQFADAYGLSLTSVRDWEQGRHVPESAALSYLRMIALDPEGTLKIRRENQLTSV